MNSKSSHKNTRSTCNAITTSGKCGMPEPDYNTDSKRARLEEHKKEHEVLSEDNHEPPVVAPSSQNGTPHESSLLPLPSTPPLTLYPPSLPRPGCIYIHMYIYTYIYIYIYIYTYIYVCI